MKVTILLLSMHTLILNCIGQTNFNGNVSVSLQERYIGLRASRTLYDGLSLWSSINLNIPNGLYIDLWEHHGLDSGNKSKQPDELDLTLDWNKRLSEDIDINISFVYLNNTPLDLWWTGDLTLESVSISKTYKFNNHVINPQFRLEWINEGEHVYSGTMMLLPNLSYVWQKPFSIDCLKLSQQIFVLWDDGFDKPKNDSEGVFLRWHVGFKWQIARKTTLTLPSYIILLPLHRGSDGRKQASSFGMTLTHSF